MVDSEEGEDGMVGSEGEGREWLLTGWNIK